MKSSEIVQCICEALVNDGNLRVKGPQTGYRCKATYSLYAGLETSILVMDAVNDVCRTVDDFRRTHSAFAVRFPKFFFEVSAKISRRCEYLVKLVILNAPALSGEVASETAPKTIFEEWMQSSEPTELVAFLRNRFPSVTTVVAHVRLEFCSEDVRCPLSGKPDKSCAYIPLTNEKVLMEYTPNGFVYQLSADSFSEVNQPMEDAIFHSIVEFLHLEKPSVEGGAQLTRRAFISGRDVNSVVKTFEPFYQDTFAATTCPCVFADALDNHIPSCKLVAKDALHEELRRYLGDGTSHFDVLLTAGRHGLHPSTATELVHLANMGCLEHLIYVSCNVVSFARDQYTLKEGFRIHHLRTFDFFPGTPYVMTVVHFRPLSLERSGGPLLILPVGPPGAGKSSCGRLLMSHFENERQCEGLTCISLKKETKKRPSCAVPRSINSSVVSNVTFMHVERDALFASCKSKHMSLRASREQLMRP